MFEKILIANRGEIAVRIARTCERMGLATVAVHSDVEADAMHVQTCDEAVAVGGAPVQESYLNVEAILEAAKKTGAQAIHPGYGLLSESAAFARQVAAAGLTFVGPTPENLEQFGDKLGCRALARSAGVRAVPGGREAVEDAEQLRTAAAEVGYPLIVKATGGGGGIGMQLVDEAEELEQAARKASERAAAAFGDSRIYLERQLERPRHLEVQLLCDAEGNCVSLGERECSIQRRHQKIIEESPSPVLSGLSSGELKQEILWDLAQRIAREGGFVNAGTAEFLMDASGGLYFLEFNPRLQVEHVITEMCTGLDLVEQQLRIAAGESLSEEARYAQTSGHAIEARIYAEDPAKDFAPRPGKVEQLRWPTVAPGRLRVETALNAGGEVTAHYDPLVAKVITHGPTRHQAWLTLDRVLAETVIEPLTTNLDFLRSVLGNEAFRAGQYDTGFTDLLLAGQKAKG